MYVVLLTEKKRRSSGGKLHFRWEGGMLWEWLECEDTVTSLPESGLAFTGTVLYIRHLFTWALHLGGHSFYCLVLLLNTHVLRSFCWTVTHGLIPGFKYCPTYHVVFIKGLEIPGYPPGSAVHTCDLPLLRVWLWNVVGRPRIGWAGCQRK